MQDEIGKVQRRREEREQEKIRSEEESQFIQRERAAAEGVELDKKEELVSCMHLMPAWFWQLR